MYPVIFGGKFMAEMDLCAAQCVRNILTFSPTAANGVTYEASFKFLKPCLVGDTVRLVAKATEVRHKAITIEVKGKRFKKGITPELVATAKFIFISIREDEEHENGKLPYVNHELSSAALDWEIDEGLD
jgi:acyl-CoA hydrolase